MGVILTVISGLYLAALYTQSIGENLDLLACFVLFVGWAFTAGYVTFEGPFVIPTNGYVAAWLGAAASVGNLVYSSKFADQMKTRLAQQSLPLMLMIGASIVVIFASVANGCCNGDEIYGIIAGAVGVIVGIIRLVVGESVDKPVAIFLAVWWSAAGIYLTFTEFKEIGNGFIGAWVALISSFVMVINMSPSSST